MVLSICSSWPISRTDPGFQFRGGGGGGALKEIAPSGGRRENVFGISCEKSRFYTKKSYFFPIAEGGAKFFLGVFRLKNHDFTQTKIIFFPILGGGGAQGAPLPGSAPESMNLTTLSIC